MNIAQWLHRSAQSYPQNPALLAGDTLVADYAEFARRAASISTGLKTHYGLKPGDRVGVFMKNRTEYLEALYGIWWAGCVAVPINAKLHGKEAAWIIHDADASLVIVSDDTARALAESEMEGDSVFQTLSVDADSWQNLVRTDTSQEEPRTHADALPQPESREDNDLAWLFYTSGTTGKPKGVMLSHGNLIAMSLCYPVDVDTVLPEDAALYAAPMSHGAGLYNFIHVRCGARHVVPLSGGFDGHEVLDLAKALNNVSLFAAPTMVHRLVAAAKSRGERGEGIKTIVYGGGPMYLADIEAALEQMGPRFVQIFGQGESPMTITALSRYWHSDTSHPRYRERLASVGVAQSAVEVRIVDSDGNPLPAGTLGEIEVRGATVMLGYWKQADTTANTINDGWLRTGDVGVLDQDGFLTLRDRSKDVIISGGTNIYPREVEEALLTHPDVREVSVVGKPDSEWGEIVVAFIVSEGEKPLNQQALDQHCLASIARFKRPKHYIPISELPKNNTGKVLKGELRKIVLKQDADSVQ